LDLDVTLSSCSDLDALAGQWRDLEGRADASFFLSWCWIGTWLASLPEAARPHVLTVRRDGEIVGLCTIGHATSRRNVVFMSNALYLNETGKSAWDVLAVEYNGILADRRWADRATEAVLESLIADQGGWDELFLSGIPCGGRAWDYASFAEQHGLSARQITQSPCRYVDLDRVRNSGRDYLYFLNRNTRYQIRRSFRRYERHGQLAFTPARDVAEARSYFDEMKQLHQAYWTGRGRPGSFAMPFFEAFHRRLIEAGTASGSVELVRVSAGDTVVGVLYNFIWAGHVYNYQCGLAYQADNAIKPGLVSHALAVPHYLARGFKIYDLMAGDARYKRSLCTDASTLVWLSARRRRFKFKLEDMLHAVKRVRR
jgi:CelD/BcsL family acetyltransferase involved in cellulose biosynthesis